MKKEKVGPQSHASTSQAVYVADTQRAFALQLARLGLSEADVQRQRSRERALLRNVIVRPATRSTTTGQAELTGQQTSRAMDFAFSRLITADTDAAAKARPSDFFAAVADNFTSNIGSLLNGRPPSLGMRAQALVAFESEIHVAIQSPQNDEHLAEPSLRRRGRPNLVALAWSRVENLLAQVPNRTLARKVTGQLSELAFYVTLHELLARMVEHNTVSNSEEDERAPTLSALAGDVWRALGYEIYALAAEAGCPNFDRRLAGDHPWRLGTDANLRALEAASGIDRQSGNTLGAVLLTLLTENSASALFEVRTRFDAGTGETRKFILPSTPLREFLSARQTSDTSLIPVMAPTIIPPRPWMTDLGSIQGGYYATGFPFFIVPWKNPRLSDYLKQINRSGSCFEQTFRAVNACQETPWRINAKLWTVVWTMLVWRSTLDQVGNVVTDTVAEPLDEARVEAWQLGDDDFDAAGNSALAEALRSAGLTPTSEVPPGPHECPEQWRDWLCSVHFAKRQFRRGRWIRLGPGARLRTATALNIIRDALSRNRVYFPFHADTRGRLYPAAGILNPQGDDLGRSLLEFASGKPLGTDAAVRALAVHGSDKAGTAKICADLGLLPDQTPTLDERYQWVLQKSEDLVRIANAPLDVIWWRETKEPFRFLAFAFAWADYVDRGLDSVCHLPVHVDGTCNGLQHIAVLTNERKLAEATNVIRSSDNSARRRDIYSEVRDQVLQRLNSLPAANDTTRMFVRQFASVLLDRDVSKRIVMVIPYGAGEQTFVETVAAHVCELIFAGGAQSVGLQDWISQNVIPRGVLKDSDQGHRQPASSAWRNDVRTWIRNEPSRLLAPMFTSALSEMFPALTEFRRTLIACIDPVMNANIPAMWVSPNGLPVIQRRFKEIIKKPDIKLLGNKLRIRMTVQSLLNDVSERAQRTGILPNYIHSLDAAHLYGTVNLAAERIADLSISVVHDSYGTHACDVDTLQTCIREAFVDLYSDTEVYLPSLARWFERLAQPTPLETTEPTHNDDRREGMRATLCALSAQWMQSSSTVREGGSQPAKSARKANSAREPVAINASPPSWLADVRQSEYFFH